MEHWTLLAHHDHNICYLTKMCRHNVCCGDQSTSQENVICACFTIYLTYHYTVVRTDTNINVNKSIMI